MKRKIILTAAVIGLVAAPSLVFAQNGADDKPKDVHQEDRQTQPNQNNSTNATDVFRTADGVLVQQRVAVPDGSISLDQAQIAALNANPSKIIQKIEIESEDGVVVYSFRFTDQSRVDVRASDGEIVRTEEATDQGGVVRGDATDDDDHQKRRGHDKDNDGEDDHKNRRGRGHRGSDHSDDN